MYYGVRSILRVLLLLYEYSAGDCYQYFLLLLPSPRVTCTYMMIDGVLLYDNIKILRCIPLT